MADKDQLIQTLADIGETLKGHKDTSTVDMDALETAVNAAVDARVKTQLEEAEKNRPDRPGEFIGPEGAKEESLGRVKGGKFDGQLKSDVLWAGMQLRKMRQLDKKNVKPESDEMTKILSATTADAGDEWVPTGMAASLWEDMFLASRVVGTIGTVPMPTDPFDMPGWGTVTFRKGTAGEAPAAQDPETFKSVLTSTELLAEIDWNYDLDEDAVIAVLPTIRSELARAGAEYMDGFCINADSTATATGNINLDDATPASDAYYLSNGQDGIRHYYIVDRTSQSADINTTLTDALFRAGKAKMGKYGVDPSNVVAYTNVKTLLVSLMGLTQVKTLDVFGPAATILTGQLASVEGVPIVPVSLLPLAEDDGKVSTTGANNDEGQIALVHRPSWRVGFRRNLLIEIDRDVRRRSFYMVASFRIAIGCRDNGKNTARGDDHTAGIHGITYA